MKKNLYTAPAAAEVKMKSDEVLLALSPNNPGINIDGDTTIDTREEQLSGRRRGKWGDLWGNY